MVKDALFDELRAARNCLNFEGVIIYVSVQHFLSFIYLGNMIWERIEEIFVKRCIMFFWVIIKDMI